jgi:glucose-1-phosphate thymidylyltransferase
MLPAPRYTHVNAVRGLILTHTAEPGGAPAFGRSPHELVPVANRPIICHALRALQDAGVREVIVAGLEPELTAIVQAVDFDGVEDMEIVFAAQNAPGGAVRGIAAAAPLLGDEPFLMQFGDALLHDDLDAIVQHGLSDGLDGVVLLQDRGWVDGAPLDFDGARLLALLGTPRRFSRSAAPVGFYLFSSAMTRLALELQDEAMSLRVAVERLLERGGRVETQRATGAWRYAGDPRHLLEGNRYMLEQLAPQAETPELEGVEVQGHVAVDPTAEVTDSTIRGPVMIGAHARICDAYIGPYTSIGRNVVVEGAEIEHSIVLPGATISHIGRRLETSIIGTGAKLFRDFRLPNALRVQVGDGAEIALA